MNRLFVRALVTILGALLILIALLAVVTTFGLRRSIGAWDLTRSTELAAAARQLLRDPSESPEVPDNLPLFVYDRQRNLIFSNRGQGVRLRNEEALIPIVADGEAIGYYQTTDIQFRSDAANRRFLESFRNSLIAGLILSLVVSFGFALLFSRTLSAPAERAARAIDKITRGDLSSAPPTGGTREFALIGDSANRLRLQLIAEQRLRNQWVHDVAHDLRTPVAALSAQFEAMRDGILDVSTERLDRTLRELGRVQALIADLEELMRLEAPEMKTVPQTVDPADLVEEARERFEPLFAVNNITFRSEIGCGTVQVDPKLVLRALTNFLANAVRHCPKEGTVTVLVTRRANSVTFGVLNSGNPIPEEDIPHVFDRLFRGEYARSSDGSGLGLTIARRIAELHDGTVTIANNNDGVVVEMQIPQSGT